MILSSLTFVLNFNIPNMQLTSWMTHFAHHNVFCIFTITNKKNCQKTWNGKWEVNFFYEKIYIILTAIKLLCDFYCVKGNLLNVSSLLTNRFTKWKKKMKILMFFSLRIIDTHTNIKTGILIERKCWFQLKLYLSNSALKMEKWCLDSFM